MATHADNLAVIRQYQPDAGFALEVIETLFGLLEGNAEAAAIKEVWEHDAKQWANAVQPFAYNESDNAKRLLADIFAGFNLGFIPKL